MVRDIFEGVWVTSGLPLKQISFSLCVSVPALESGLYPPDAHWNYLMGTSGKNSGPLQPYLTFFYFHIRSFIQRKIDFTRPEGHNLVLL